MNQFQRIATSVWNINYKKYLGHGEFAGSPAHQQTSITLIIMGTGMGAAYGYHNIYTDSDYQDNKPLKLVALSLGASGGLISSYGVCYALSVLHPLQFAGAVGTIWMYNRYCKTKLNQ